MEIHKYICENCQFKTNFNSAWIKHLDSKKHERKGKTKIHTCNKCNYETKTHWNLKMHYMNMHSTLEERIICKYYCLECDKVYFSPLYFNNHIKGIKHINQSKINKLNQEPKLNL